MLLTHLFFHFSRHVNSQNAICELKTYQKQINNIQQLCNYNLHVTPGDLYYYPKKRCYIFKKYPFKHFYKMIEIINFKYKFVSLSIVC